MTLSSGIRSWLPDRDLRQAAGAALLLIGPFAALAGNSASDIWLSLVAVAFLVRSAVKRDWAWLSETWVRLAIVFWIWLCLCAVLSSDPGNALDQAGPWIRFPVFAAALALWLSPAKRRDGMLAALGAALVIMMAVLLVERLEHPSAIRLYGTWGQNTKAGWFLVGMGLPVILWCLHGLKERGRAVAWKLLLLLAIVFSCFSTGEIYVTISVLFAIALYALLLRPSPWLLAIGGAVAALSVLGLFVLNDELFYRFTSELVQRLPWRPTSDYFDPWIGGIRTGLLHPLVGVGPDNFDVYCDALKAKGTLAATLGIKICQSHPHNLYIQAFAEAGVIGLVLFVLLVAVLLIKAWKLHPLTSRQFSTMAPFVILVVVFWPVSTYSEAFGQHKNFFTWFLVGWAMAQCTAQLHSQGTARAVPEPPRD